MFAQKNIAEKILHIITKYVRREAKIMSDFEKDLYRQMGSEERVWLFMVKMKDILEFIDLMTDQDEKGLQFVLEGLKKANRQKPMRRKKNHMFCATSEIDSK